MLKYVSLVSIVAYGLQSDNHEFRISTSVWFIDYDMDRGYMAFLPNLSTSNFLMYTNNQIPNRMFNSIPFTCLQRDVVKSSANMPPDLFGIMPVDTYSKARLYNLDRITFGIFNSLFDSIVGTVSFFC